MHGVRERDAEAVDARGQARGEADGDREDMRDAGAHESLCGDGGAKRAEEDPGSGEDLGEGGVGGRLGDGSVDCGEGMLAGN